MYLFAKIITYNSYTILGTKILNYLLIIKIQKIYTINKELVKYL